MRKIHSPVTLGEILEFKATFKEKGDIQIGLPVVIGITIDNRTYILGLPSVSKLIAQIGQEYDWATVRIVFPREYGTRYHVDSLDSRGTLADQILTTTQGTVALLIYRKEVS